MTHELDPRSPVLERLERRARNAERLSGAALLALLVTLVLGLAVRQAPVDEVIRARGFELVDAKGVVRLRLGQDPADTQRRSRSAGLTVFDATGAERGGFSTFDDGSVVLALDAPEGVGSPMRDRLGLYVGPDGSCNVMLLDNQTRAVAKLQSDGAGGGGVQVFEWDMEKKEIHVKTETYAGEVRETMPMGG